MNHPAFGFWGVSVFLWPAQILVTIFSPPRCPNKRKSATFCAAKGNILWGPRGWYFYCFTSHKVLFSNTCCHRDRDALVHCFSAPYVARVCCLFVFLLALCAHHQKKMPFPIMNLSQSLNNLRGREGSGTQRCQSDAFNWSLNWNRSAGSPSALVEPLSGTNSKESRHPIHYWSLGRLALESQWECGRDVEGVTLRCLGKHYQSQVLSVSEQVAVAK